MNRPAIFEAREPSGKTYRIFEDGSTEGFEEGTVIANFALAWVNVANVK